VRLLVVGAGGHARVVVDAARASGMDVVGVVGKAEGRSDLLGAPISESAEGVIADGFIIAVGDNRARAKLFADYIADGLRPVSVVHPSAVVAQGVDIGEGTLVTAGVVVNVGTRVGANAILNTSCTVDHDCVIGDHVHVGPTTGLCGGVQVGSGALIGVGCSITPLRSVGEWSTVGAGAVVVADVPAREMHVGVPARVMKSTEE